MNRIAKFETVSLNKFVEDMKTTFFETNFDETAIEILYNNITNIMPKRSTSGSAGYDIHTPFSFKLEPGESIIIPTGLRCSIRNDYVLLIMPRSGLGFKYRCMLANTIGVIDSDYYEADNEGHIMIKLVNGGSSTMHIKTGDRICQGLFIQYGITEDDEADGSRTGGFGSTGK